MSKKNQLPSVQIAWECASLALDNAIKHLEWAKKMANRKDWGIGTAHLVLSLEEATKSAILAVYSLECLPLMQHFLELFMSKFPTFGREPLDLSEIVRYSFSRHSVKHVAAFNLLLLFWMNTKYKKKPNSEKNIAFLGRIFWDLLKSSRKPDGLFAMIEWLHKADELKKRGFYVDHAANGPLTPKSVAEKDYQQGLTVVHTLVTKLQQIKDVWNETKVTRDHFAKQLSRHCSDIKNDVSVEIENLFTENEVIALLKIAEEQFDPEIFALPPSPKPSNPPRPNGRTPK